MTKKQFLREDELPALAKKCREKAGASKADAARALGVGRGTIHQAEEYPEISLTGVRRRIIEKYSKFRVAGPYYKLRVFSNTSNK